MKQIDLLCQRYPALRGCAGEIEAATQCIVGAYRQGGKLLLCGNGGSCADAAHIVGELMKAFCLPRPLTQAQKNALRSAGEDGEVLAGALQQGLPAIDLSVHTALCTAFQNDVEPTLCFAQQAFVYAQPCDVFWGISTSGNSDNVLRAGVAAKAKGAKTIGLTGQNACRMDRVFDIVIHVPECETYRVQEYHLPVYHAMCLAIEAAFFEGC